MEVARTKHEIRRLAMPRKLPMKPPIGPRQVTTGVNWAGWKESVEVDARQGIDSSSLGKLVDAWYAGVEQELLKTFGLDNGGDGDDFFGTGLIRNEAMGCSEGRFRDTPDWTGLLGQRLGWTSKALHLTWRHGSALINDHGHEHMQVREAKLDMLRRFGYRACALLKSWEYECRRMLEKAVVGFDSEDMQVKIFHDARGAVRNGLHFLAGLVRGRHRRRPGWERLANGLGSLLIIDARDLMVAIEKVINDLTALRSKCQAREVRTWARMSTLKEAHRCTKPPEETARKTASAFKGYMGEMTAQQAADKGRKEWGRIRNSTDADDSEMSVKSAEALFAVGQREGDKEDLLLSNSEPIK